jgi:GAF domain-containing protein
MPSSEYYHDACETAKKMADQGMPVTNILLYLTNIAENGSVAGSVASILLLDKDGLLRNGASPRLPADYLAAIDGICPDPNLGTCASAAATGCMVITPDFQADDKWAELKHLPMALGFKGAWSMPIKTNDSRVIGTFGTYFVEKRKPTRDEINGVKILASAAAEIITGIDIRVAG